MSIRTKHFAKAEMLIRKPIAQVFEAFIDPEITSKFWFTKSSGRLEQGASVDWVWEMYNLTVPVLVKTIDSNKRIVIEWGTGKNKSTVEWIFKPLGEHLTFVEIINYDFQGSNDEIISKVIDSTGGFTLVISGLKAWMEHEIELKLIGDKFPIELNAK